MLTSFIQKCQLNIQAISGILSRLSILIIEALRNIQKYIYEAFKGIHKAFKGIQEHSRALKVIQGHSREFKRGKQGVTFMRPKAFKDAQIDLY